VFVDASAIDRVHAISRYALLLLPLMLHVTTRFHAAASKYVDFRGMMSKAFAKSVKLSLTVFRFHQPLIDIRLILHLNLR